MYVIKTGKELNELRGDKYWFDDVIVITTSCDLDTGNYTSGIRAWVKSDSVEHNATILKQLIDTIERAIEPYNKPPVG